ncbi:hypothetical protein SAMN05444365_101175 [Micromonospora pattaloongensis]|uniref:Uncharacterized protein n=1 Tax=Micromonospora pattaloongensis TaxID=405436 RepID=A0A1H3FVG9_9ACTN|nr:hypothetical protein [Micromonospora pattaloongensis]SDX94930.1 hypothetical protein SAMN05444365_101175 [Micromonospora pattaloongensis]
MNGPLATLTIVASLVLAGWAGVATARNRPPGRSHLVGLGVLGLIVVALTVAAVIAIAEGERPASMATFVGYLVTIVCLPPLGWVLARMEPTRWGSGIVMTVCLVVPVLVLRLEQTWSVVSHG